MLVNGVTGNLIGIRDRGLLYGDGVFRTLRTVKGQTLHWPLHYKKLQHDCAALGIACPDFLRLSEELAGLLVQHPDGVFKLIVTRGLSQRGYAPFPHASATHIWDVSPLPSYPENWQTQGVTLGLCELRLALQPRLAGIKHLNRLENVLAAAECLDVAEGLLLDQAGCVIEGVRSNIFLVLRGVLVTPMLNHCGVAGVQRDRVMACAIRLGITVEVREVGLDEVRAADEVFLTNSVFGLWSVREFDNSIWTNFKLADLLRVKLEEECA